MLKYLSLIGIAAVIVLIVAANFIWQQNTGVHELSQNDAARAVNNLFVGTNFNASDVKVINWYGMQDSGSQAKFTTTREAVDWILNQRKLEKVTEFPPSQADDPAWWDPGKADGEVFAGGGDFFKFNATNSTMYLKSRRVLK